ncbi:RsmD family RNA methyltransferase [Porphyromonas pogonae]|uniref:RsmD family RNA methyltransferase n=1 Tax=Porphyromonas pogonae TaxID=867595 RepID=UPI002E786169|nr:RsmD family RNA methyltransferase [Porphyromonas pogonae]
MRIVGGVHKSRRFDVPKSFNARPTTDFAKENLFNVLNNMIEFDEAVALDLFAGTGSITFELISRGCDKVVSVELRREHSTFIESVAQKLKETQRLKMVKGDVFKFLQSSSYLGAFDFVFADPPYKLKELGILPRAILDSGKLKPGALLIVEHPGTYDFKNEPEFTEHREYGSVNFSFFVAPVAGE